MFDPQLRPRTESDATSVSSSRLEFLAKVGGTSLGGAALFVGFGGGAKSPTSILRPSVGNRLPFNVGGTPTLAQAQKRLAYLRTRPLPELLGYAGVDSVVTTDGRTIIRDVIENCSVDYCPTSTPAPRATLRIIAWTVTTAPLGGPIVTAGSFMDPNMTAYHSGTGPRYNFFIGARIAACNGAENGSAATAAIMAALIVNNSSTYGAAVFNAAKLLLAGSIGWDAFWATVALILNPELLIPL